MREMLIFIALNEISCARMSAYGMSQFESLSVRQIPITLLAPPKRPLCATSSHIGFARALTTGCGNVRI
jgi:hypothetical protein